jgi:hypothetical protein
MTERRTIRNGETFTMSYTIPIAQNPQTGDTVTADDGTYYWNGHTWIPVTLTHEDPQP